ncbi:hypothetical protein ACFQ5F_09575 [Kroppenstedtia eburnea]|uniref:hypothetical protein n=1 Tax=Kroppenstedtia eburnea TaxID=714067 RepID=UPI00362F2E47
MTRKKKGYRTPSRIRHQVEEERILDQLTWEEQLNHLAEMGKVESDRNQKYSEESSPVYRTDPMFPDPQQQTKRVDIDVTRNIKMLKKRSLHANSNKAFIHTDDLVDGSVTHEKLGRNSVNNNNIQPGAVESTHLKEEVIHTSKLAPHAVTSSKLAEKSVKKKPPW